MVRKFNVLTLLTGADEELNKKVLLTFFSLFCLLSSYYLIKPLRKGFYFSEFSAELLPYFHLGVIILITMTTAVVVKLFRPSNSTNSTKIFLLLVTFINLILGLTLLSPNKINVACFCLWSSIYFPLSLALFWGGVNQNFDTKSSKSSYAFIWIGAILGALCGSFLTILLNKYIQSFHWGYQFLFSTIFMFCAIFSFQKMIKLSTITDSNYQINNPPELESGNLVLMIRNLLKNPYLTALTIIIFSLTFSRGVFDLESDAIVEREVAFKLYRNYFWDLNQTVSQDDNREQINSILFEFIFNYKNLSDKSKNEAYKSITSKLNLSIDRISFNEKYEKFRRAIKREITLFNSEIWTYQNSISLFFLLICKIQFISKIGIRPLIMCLPLTYVAVFLLLFTPIGLREIFILKVLTLSLDYSLHNTAKEILYVPLGTTANLSYKPIIEGPFYKLGAASSSAYKIVLDGLLYLVSSAHFIGHIFLATAAIVAIFWAQTARTLSLRFESLKS
ncbi:MAG: Npt1/Npt2 family nucleotide transporter [bacterium]|nr:Npt1/Npt2 family nucleotide transporter [bacterium]